MDSQGWITSGPHQAGSEQMDLDRRMADATAQDGRTRIRFYEFRPPCLSLGHHQRRMDIDEAAVQERGFSVAVRPTGGRAVLHKGDFVYSVTTTDAGLSPGSTLHTGVYNLVTLALAQGLRTLGVEPDDAARHLSGPHSDNLPKLCFSSATRHEITVQGRKLVGSAQRLLRGVVLQHGSLLATREHLELVDLLAGLDPTAKHRTRAALEARTICLRELGIEANFGELAAAFRESFGAVFSPLHDVDPSDIAPS